MKSHFPRYAKITLFVLVLLIIFIQFRLKALLFFGSADIMFFGFEFVIIFMLCLIGRRVERVLLVAVTLEWLLIILFFKDVFRYVYYFHNNLLFLILEQVPIIVLVAYLLFKKSRHDSEFLEIPSP